MMLSDEAQAGGAGGPSPWRVAGWGLALLLLLLPLAAMQVTTEVEWTFSDFVFAAFLIGGVGLGLEFAVRASGSGAYRAGMAVLLLTVFLLVWINAAVGIIGNEDNPLNLMYGGVILVALAGGAMARFRAAGLAKATGAAAAVQTAIMVGVAVAGGSEPPGPWGLMLLNGAFAAMLAGSCWLFGRASRG